MGAQQWIALDLIWERTAVPREGIGTCFCLNPWADLLDPPDLCRTLGPGSMAQCLGIPAEMSPLGLPVCVNGFLKWDLQNQWVPWSPWNCPGIKMEPVRDYHVLPWGEMFIVQDVLLTSLIQRSWVWCGFFSTKGGIGWSLMVWIDGLSICKNSEAAFILRLSLPLIILHDYTIRPHSSFYPMFVPNFQVLVEL